MPSNAATLVRTFLSEVPLAFAFMVNRSARTPQTTIRHLTTDGLRDVAPEQIAGWFWALWRVETERLVVEVAFGDREWVLAVTAAPPGLELEFELWEWCDLAPTSSVLRSGDAQFCDSPERLQAVLRHQAAALQQLAGRIQAWELRDIALLREARAERNRSSIAARRESQHARACAEADDAFRAREFRRVVQLLSPLGDLLSPAEHAKLDLARRKLGPDAG